MGVDFLRTISISAATGDAVGTVAAGCGGESELEEARAVLAADIGAPEGAAQPMPDPPPVDLSGAHLLVLLGPDLAGG